jgi:hypothetical protein
MKSKVVSTVAAEYFNPALPPDKNDHHVLAVLRPLLRCRRRHPQSRDTTNDQRMIGGKMSGVKKSELPIEAAPDGLA